MPSRDQRILSHIFLHRARDHYDAIVPCSPGFQYNKRKDTSKSPLSIPSYQNDRRSTKTGKVSNNLIRIPLGQNRKRNFTTPPNIYVLNAASIAKPHAMEGLHTELKNNSIDIAIITETHLKEHHQHGIFTLTGYDTIRRDRQAKKGGGVAIFVLNNLTYEVIDLDSEHEIIWLKVNYNNTNYIFGAIYHPPCKKYKVNMIDHLMNIIETLEMNYPRHIIILAGDFNELSDADIREATGTLQLVNCSTRGKNILDRIYVSEDIKWSVQVMNSLIKTDHKAIVARSYRTEDNMRKHRQKHSIRLRKPKQTALFLEELTKTKPLFNVDEPFEDSCDKFNNQLIHLLNKYFPLKEVTTTSKDPPFVTPYIKKLLRQKNTKMKKGDLVSAEKISSEIRKHIIKTNSNRLRTMNIRKQAKEIWTEVKSIRAKGNTSVSQPTNNGITAEELNNHYTNISTEENYVEPTPMSGPSTSCPFLSEMDIHTALKKLKKTATGPDGLPYWFLKISADHISSPLTDLINESIKQSKVPKMWKCAAISPIPKVAKPTLPADYRPISITSILSRVTEKLLIRKYLNKAIQGRQEFNDQYAFRPTGSTTAALIALTKAVTDNLEHSNHTRVLALDFSKAFDTVNHQSLFSKLSQLCIPKEIFNWMISFFKEHQHYTIFGGDTSTTTTINSGVIQGSALGPFAYVVVASDLKPTDTNNSLIKYADDTYLVIRSDSVQTAQEELTNVQTWAAANNLKLNSGKTREIIFKRPRSKTMPTAIPGILRVDKINILGVTMTQTMSMKEHISALIKKCHSNIYAIKLLRSRGLEKKSAHNIFQALIVNRLLYACQCWWGFVSKEDKHRIQQLLKRSARFGFCSSDTNFTETVSSMEDRLFKCVLMSNHVLHHLIPPKNMHQYNLRSNVSSHNCIRSCLTNQSQKHFIQRQIHKDAIVV